MTMRLWLQLKIVWSGLVWASFGFSVMLLWIACHLQSWHFVQGDVHIEHLVLLYEHLFSLVPIFIFAQLFAEETEEHILGWALSLPFPRFRWLAERWLIGIGMVLLLYYGSLTVIHFTTLSIPWQRFTTEVLIPSLWLGHLALAVTLGFRNVMLGMLVPLFYWGVEFTSNGRLSGDWYLFAASFPISQHFQVNRGMYGVLSLAALGLAYLLLIRRRQ